MSEIEGLVAFSILMENNDGILGKAPDYVHEKHEFCMKMDDPSRMLDNRNKWKFDNYMERWFKEDD